MRQTSRTQYRTLFLLVVLAVAALGFGCHHAPPAAAPPPPAPAPPPAKPTVTLQAAPSSIQKGESATLTWSSTNATELKLEPGLGTVAPEGSTKVSPSDSTAYTITATGPGGSADASASVTVVQPPPPPPPPPQPTVEELFLKEVQDAYFDYNKADIRADARDALAKTGDFFRRYPEVKVTIEGHCDERGSTEYNIALGDRRAQAVRQYLVSLGISADRMNTVSYGKEKPFCTDHNEECWQQNRRGHFILAH
ncbi:MAG: peptidoglycan-associated lipoprotein Pal [Candidatus Acidiferrales bacterium]